MSAVTGSLSYDGRMRLPFPIGTRVQIRGHGGFPDGTKGTVASVHPVIVENSSGPDVPRVTDAAVEAMARQGNNRKVVSQFVRFDSPTDDGSGDGPYVAAEVMIDYLHALEDR